MTAIDTDAYREQLNCNFKQVDDIFADCIRDACRLLSDKGVDAYLDGASSLCNMGRGQELPLIYLEVMPRVANLTHEMVLKQVVETSRVISRNANSKAMPAFLNTLPGVARRLEEGVLMRAYFILVERMAREAGDGLIPFFQHVEYLLGDITIEGLAHWVEQGLDGYKATPWKYAEWFSLQAQDSRAAMIRERHGTLFIDHERRLQQYLQGFWDNEEELHPFSLAFDIVRKPQPHFDSKGFHLPDVLDDMNGISGIDRYRATLAHMVAHRLWTQPFIADNFNRFQHIFIEAFEDARVEYLAMQRYPGLRRIWKALHPVPQPGACPEGWSCIRHKAAMLSRALLDPTDHPYTDELLLQYVDEFYQRIEADPHDTKIATELGVRYLTKVHEVAFRSPKVFFDDTEVSYRDDNRYMWIFLEDTDDEDEFHSEHSAANTRTDEDDETLFVRHLREWDCEQQRYQSDWVTVYEAIQPAGDAKLVDELLEKHRPLAKRLHRIVDLLKPQQQVRERYQEDGDELDLDLAIRALTDYRAGSQPDPRINYSHRTDGRDIAVMLLLDLSQSINDVPEGAEQTILQLSQEAVSLLGWAVDALGDPFAIAGFASNTRHEVRYRHFKSFGEKWDHDVKARIAAMEGGLSTRMGAALRNAGNYLSKRDNEKKLLLVLTDGEPHDVDQEDPTYLRQDTKKAVEEMAMKGVYTYCISLDTRADDYIGDIFGNHYTVVDHIERLPERLSDVFLSLTG